MADYYIPHGRAIGNPHGKGLIKPGDPIPPLTAEQIARFVADGSLAVAPVTTTVAPPPPAPEPIKRADDAPEQEGPPILDDEPAPGLEIPTEWPAGGAKLTAFLADYERADVLTLQAADGRKSCERYYKKRIKELGG